MLKYIPNMLTILRLLLIPFIIFNIFAGNYILAFILFTFSACTDIADGYIARKFNLISNLGKLLDPLADKLTQLSILTSLVINNMIPFWILLIILLKEFILIVGTSFLYGKGIVVYSKWYGKLATNLLYLAIVCSLLFKQFNLDAVWDQVVIWLYCIALASSLFALVMYTRNLYNKGLIDKGDLNKEVIVDKKERKQKQKR